MHPEPLRDLLFTAALFGLATIVWAGWAQERPPAGWGWRVVLAVLSAAGLALLGLSVPVLVRNWDAPTALVSGSPVLVAYIVVFWAEVVVVVGLAILFVRTKRTSLIAPSVLIVVGTHFIPLAVVFGQLLLAVAAVLAIAAGVVAIVLRRRGPATSFWCGLLAAPVFLILGGLALVSAHAA